MPEWIRTTTDQFLRLLSLPLEYGHIGILDTSLRSRPDMESIDNRSDTERVFREFLTLIGESSTNRRELSRLLSGVCF